VNAWNNLSYFLGDVPASENYVLNSNFEIWQRGTSIDINLPSYSADRWEGLIDGPSTGMVVSRQPASLVGFRYCARVQRSQSSNATLPHVFRQPIESVISNTLAGRQITLSFYARRGANYSGLNNALSVSVNWSDGLDEGFRSTGYIPFIAEDALLTTSWKRYSFAGTVPAVSSGLTLIPQVEYSPTGTAGQDDFFEITGVQLEAGGFATPYRPQFSSFGTELAASQRYYQRFQGGVGCALNGVASSSTNWLAQYSLPVSIRKTVAPTYSGQLIISDQYLSDPTTANAIASVHQGANVLGGRIQFSGFTGLTTGRYYSAPGSSIGSGALVFNAEI
jgi:hypothetical protein